MHTAERSDPSVRADIGAAERSDPAVCAVIGAAAALPLRCMGAGHCICCAAREKIAPPNVCAAAAARGGVNAVGVMI